MLLVGVMGGLDFCLELAFFRSMDGPRLVNWTPKVSLIIYFLGVGLSIFWFLLLPLLFPSFILGLFYDCFLTMVLPFYFHFEFSWR